MDMDTDALRWFQQVADGTTVTEGSELEAVTQSGVSRALARLEAQIGTALVRSFRDEHPHVTFQLTQVRDEVHSAALDGGLADLEIGTRRARSAALPTR